MIRKTLSLRKGFRILRPVLIVCWLYLLRSSPARHFPYYLLAGIALLLAMCPTAALSGWKRTWAHIGSGFFAFAVALANYQTYSHLYQGILCFLCGVAVADTLFCRLIGWSEKGWNLHSCSCAPWIIWGTAMALFSGVYLLILHGCYYPGNATPDSIWQIEQFVSGVYTNHHPFYHTQMIRVFYELGMALFGNANQAMMLFSVFQILTMSGIFAYVIVTMYQQKLPLLCVLLCTLWFAFLPAHVMYSFSVWKDVLWGGMVTLFLTALFRIFFRVGKWSWLNHLLILPGGLGFCLLRNNGWLAFVLFAVLFLVFFFRSYPRLSLGFIAMAVLCWFMNGPVLDRLGILPSPVLESLAIPTQQIGLVLQEEYPLMQEEADLLNQVLDIEQIREAYTPNIVDPIKNVTRVRGNESFLAENLGAFLKIWIQIGLRHPWTYVRAWIDQTVGYWNSGYPYWVWQGRISENSLGLSQTVHQPHLLHFWQEYLNAFETTGLSLFISIGFHIWLVAGAFILCAANKRWHSAFLSLPLLAIVLTLLVATPVFAEFRYSYAVFTSLPVVLMAAGCPEDRKSYHRSNGE